MNPSGHALVVGAGLAGAGVAWRLTQSGWRVTLIDAAPQLAAGASGLPFGVLAPPPPLKHTLAPVALEWLHLAYPVAIQRLLQLMPNGQGWQQMALHDSRLTDHAMAHVVSPAHWVQAYVQQAQCSGRLALCLGEAVVSAQLDAQNTGWCLTGERGTQWQGDAVVWANAMAAASHLPTVAVALQAVAGQLSMGPCTTPRTAEVRRDHGVWVNAFDADGLGPRWSVGATYRRGQAEAKVIADDHTTNRAKLARLQPQALAEFDRAQANHILQAWSGVRCTTAQRLPLVGTIAQAAAPARRRVSLASVPRLPQALALLALGSRGLTSHALAADIVAAHLQGQRLPVPVHVARALDPARAWLKQLRSGAPTGLFSDPISK